MLKNITFNNYRYTFSAQWELVTPESSDIGLSASCCVRSLSHINVRTSEQRKLRGTTHEVLHELHEVKTAVLSTILHQTL